MRKFEQGIIPTQHEEIEDCALADLPATVEFVTFVSGKLGTFTKKETSEMVRLTVHVAESGKLEQRAVVYENNCKYFILRSPQVDRSTEQEIII